MHEHTESTSISLPHQKSISTVNREGLIRGRSNHPKVTDPNGKGPRDGKQRETEQSNRTNKRTE